MSLFGSLMREMERDPIFGAHQRAMNRMMNSFFGGPAAGGFGMSLMPSPMGMGHHHPHHEERDDLMPFGGGAMNPFGAFGGFPDMSRMMSMDPTNGHGHGHGPGHQHAFSSSSFVSISSGPDGRPQVYQASSETRQGPDGLRETRKALQDSRSGTKKLAVGRHLGEQAHVVEREQNLRTGQLNENHEFYNLEEEEAPVFDREWSHRARHSLGGGYAHSSSMPAIAAAPHHAPQAALGSSSARSSYIEQPTEEEPQEIQGYPSIGYQPQHSQSAVTIEELPASDDEAEQLQQQSRHASSAATARRSYPHATTAPSSAGAAGVAPSTSSSRRSPYGTSKEKRQKRSRNGKKY